MNHDFRLADEYEPFFSISYDEFCERFYQEKAEKECMKMLFPEEEEAEEELPLFDEEFPHKNMRRAYHRKKTEAKARRKEHLASEIYTGGWNAPHGYFRKGKIHCSCPMCSAKTNASLNKSKGKIDPNNPFRGCRLSGTNGRYGKKNYKPSDRKKVDSLLSQFSDTF